MSFDNLPQAPFAYFNAHFFGSERGPLDTPTQCGTYEVKTTGPPGTPPSPSRPPASSSPSTKARVAPPARGPRPFHPAFQAASASNTAAAHTSFALTSPAKTANRT